VTGYVEGFAVAYDRFWAPYPRRMAEAWLAFHHAVAPRAERSLLDVGCGTGILAARFVEAGYRVTGLDTAEAMLARARDRLGDRATVLRADAAEFTLDQGYALALSTYDIPNHLGGIDRVRSYVRCVHAAVRPGGWFGFDLCTLRGLRSDVPGVSRGDDAVSVAVERGTWHDDRRPLRISGAVHAADGAETRFETTIGNAAYPVADVLAALTAAGWVDTYVAALDDLHTPIADAEQRDRVAVVARRAE
jgi:SAM-dependent methyltransferase